MRGNRQHSTRIPWYLDAMRPGARWLVRLPRGTEAAEQRPTGGDTNGLAAFCWLRELTAREPLTRMARTGIDSDGPCAHETDRTGRPGEPSARAPGGLTAKGTDVLCVRLGKADGW
jgi:hypothetical protein